jgi:ABC-type nitrate/sulfonate/bicarbonate transport system substrate-binding protein
MASTGPRWGAAGLSSRLRKASRISGRKSGRRLWLKAAPLAIVGTLCLVTCGPVGASASSTYHLNVGVFPGYYETSAVLVAQKEGFFAKNHLSVSLIPSADGPDIASVLASGDTQVAAVPPDNALPANAQGADMVAVAGDLGEDPWQVMVRNGYPTPDASKGYPADAKDLKGATFGVFALNSGSQHVAEEVLKEAGLNPQTSVTWVALAGVSSVVTAFKTGAIDAYLTTSPINTIILNDKVGRYLINMQAGQGPTVFKGYLGDSWFANAPAVKSDPAPYRAFSKAIQEADSWINASANASRLAGILGPYLSVSTSLAKQIVADNRGALVYKITPQQVTNVSKWLVGSGLIPKTVTYSQYIAPGFAQYLR